MSDVLSAHPLSTSLATSVVETPSPVVSNAVMLDFSFYPDVVDLSGTLEAGSTLSAISVDDTNFTPVTGTGNDVTTALSGQYLTFAANTQSVYTLAPIAGETQSDINAINAALASDTVLTDSFYYQLSDGTVDQLNVQLDDLAIGTSGTVSPGVTGTFAPANTVEVEKNTTTPIPGLTVDAAVSTGEPSDAQQFMTVTVALLDFSTGQNDGTLSLTEAAVGSAAGGTITTDGDGSIIIAGSIAQINADLQGLTYHSPTASAGDDFIIVDTVQGPTVEGEIITACYAAGTRIETLHGPVAIECLRIGDEVRSLSGHMRPIHWIGRRSYDSRFAAANPDVWPVLIRAGALDDAVPARDLYVSPRHAMFLDGVLIPAAELVNGLTIVHRAPTARVDYFHLDLADHDVILAEGAASESYIDHDNRQMFQNAAEHAQRCDRQPAQDCAPRLEQGVIVDAVRARLTARAIAQGYAPPHVHSIMLDGAGLVRATVPAGVTEVHLLSNNGKVHGDRRTLGALLRELRLDSARLTLAEPCLLRGFHAAERHGSDVVRWTNGQGVMTLPYSEFPHTLDIVVGAVVATDQAA